MDELSKAIKVLAEARLYAEAVENAYDAAMREWEQQHAPMLADRELRKAATKEAEAIVRELAIAAYNDTGDKKPHPAATIRVMRRVDYEKDDALIWVKANAPTLLVLDKKGFESGVKAGLFANAPALVVDDPTAAISRDLDIYALEDTDNDGAK